MSQHLPIRPWLPLLFILAVRLTLSLTYSLINPAWESYDEPGHFAYARYVAKYHTLLQPGDPEAEEILEKFQPPLYYLVIAPFIAGFDLGETFQVPNRNPYFYNGLGINYAVHSDDPRRVVPPLEIALHVARGISALLSTASIVFVYLAARRLWPTRTAPVWAATLLYAFWPQFLFIGSMVTNDALATALSALLCYLIIRLVVDGFHPGVALGLGFALAAAMLTKLNTLAFILPALAALFLSLSRYTDQWKAPRTWIIALSLGLLLLAILGLLSSLQFVTTHVFHLTLIDRFLRSAIQLATEPPSRQFLLSDWKYPFRTFLAAFGWGNPEAYSWLYGIGAVGLILALVSSVLRFVRRSYPSKGLFLVLGLQIASPIALTLLLGIAYQSLFLLTGRYLLPALPATVLGLIGSWQWLLTAKRRIYLWKIISVSIVIIGWAIPFEIIAPAYAKPQPLENRARIEYPMKIVFNQAIELLGANRLPPIYPDSNVAISLCWQALRPVTNDYSVSLEVIGPDGEGYGQLEMYPGRGNYPTSFWTVHQPFCDDYTLHVRGDVPSPAAATIRVLLLDGVQGDPLRVTNSSGEDFDPSIVTLPLKIKAYANALSAPSYPVSYRFGEGINLIGYDLETLSESRQVRITLHWKILEDIHDNYIVFIHLRDTPTHVYAQNDSQPRQGWYPTSLWESGEVVFDEHTITLGEQATAPLDVYLGLYDPTAGIRLAVFDEEGNLLVNDEVKLVEGLELKNRP
jgi:hypothetical protein